MARFAKNRRLERDTAASAVRPPVGPSSLRPTSPTNGLFRFNTSNTVLEVYYGGVWNNVAKEGVSVIAKDQFTGAIGVTNFTMTYSYASGREAQVLVFVGGVFQVPGTAYTFNGTTTIAFATAPPLGQTVVILHNFPSTVTV
jgi:hypothetical protein